MRPNVFDGKIQIELDNTLLYIIYIKKNKTDFLSTFFLQMSISTYYYCFLSFNLNKLIFNKKKPTSNNELKSKK